MESLIDKINSALAEIEQCMGTDSVKATRLLIEVRACAYDLYEEATKAALPEGVARHIAWIHRSLRESDKCIDGGTCHHGCGADNTCFRTTCCVPLGGSKLEDDWSLPK